MTLTNLRCFMEAARCENFTQAAKNLYISQPGLSKQVFQVENEVGTPLFFRVNRGVKLTPSGRYLYEQLKDVPEQVTRAVEHARAMGRGYSGKLLVGVLEGQEMNKIILSRLTVFNSNYPEMDVHLERNSFSNIRTGLQNGHYDLAITLSFELETIEDAVYKIIMSQRGAFAINRQHPKSGIENLNLGMLKNENFLSISPNESPNGYTLLLKQCANYGFAPKVIRQLSSLESLLLGVEAGMGIAMLDRNTRLEKNSEVRIVPIENSDYSHVVAVWNKNNKNPAVANLAKTLAE